MANREEGYTEQLMRELEPLTVTISQMIYAVNERKRRKEAELQFAAVTSVSEGRGSRFTRLSAVPVHRHFIPFP